MSSVTVPTLDPVFPRTCPGCDRSCDSSETLAGVERSRSLLFALIGRAELAFLTQHTVRVPMCSRCAGYGKKVQIPFLVGGFAIVCVLVLFIGFSSEGNQVDQERLMREMIEHPEQFTEGPPKTRFGVSKFWGLVPPLLFLGLVFVLDQKRPARIVDMGREPAPFLAFEAQSRRWLSELSRMN